MASKVTAMKVSEKLKTMPTISERTSNSVTAIHRVTMELRKVRIINS